MGLGIDLNTHVFETPHKEVKTAADIPAWEKSEGYRDYLGFLHAMNDAVKGRKLSDDVPVSQTVEKLLELLEILDTWIDEIPPIDQPQRFGNKAFRDWFKRLEEQAEELLKKAMDEKYHKALPEVMAYLVEGVGNSTRIDYGTGHEMSFAAFLLCLYKIGVLTEEDAPAVVLKLFNRYLLLVRKLQVTYRMEPAGSHGVWSLDDYQFIPFLWGSAQLIGHQRIFPKSFLNPDIYETFSKDYMFLSCIKYISEVKSGPFAEHSNMLWSISDVPHWTKVNTGLFKMYKAEVLCKHPIIQHFLFGSLISFKPAS
ncbi:serine/threonine-protein phosphatase 2A activator-like [Liolophura sinensis]|uniref:serine/threonine-protein phosphatase 2A activator-like n=1 Tax=Liolophura sinensis TaxID=3198878 RepID=UPI0031590929